MSDWLSHPIPRATVPKAVRTSPTAPDPGMIRLDDLAGPSEAMQAAGLTNRGSIHYAIQRRGFPEPLLTLRGIRLWSLTAVKEWAAQSERTRTD